MASAHNDSITGTAAFGAAFHLSDKHPSLSILTIYKEHICSGNRLNNCRQNYSYSTCLAEECRTRNEAERLFPQMDVTLLPAFKAKHSIDTRLFAL